MREEKGGEVRRGKRIELEQVQRHFLQDDSNFAVPIIASPGAVPSSKRTIHDTSSEPFTPHNGRNHKIYPPL
jgi:hypothetical protein